MLILAAAGYGLPPDLVMVIYRKGQDTIVVGNIRALSVSVIFTVKGMLSKLSTYIH